MLYDLIFNDNTAVSVSMAGVGQQGDLWIHVHGMTVSDCAIAFSDPDKTEHMHINYDETIKDDFEGFTNLFYVAACDDFVKVGMERSASNA